MMYSLFFIKKKKIKHKNFIYKKSLSLSKNTYRNRKQNARKINPTPPLSSTIFSPFLFIQKLIHPTCYPSILLHSSDFDGGIDLLVVLDFGLDLITSFNFYLVTSPEGDDDDEEEQVRGERRLER